MTSKVLGMRDFSSGVVNQELQNRDNGNGVFFDAKNVISSWNGEVGRRTGTRWVRTLTGPSRIIPFRKPDGNDIILLLGNGTIEGYVFSDETHIEPFFAPGGPAPTFPTTGWAGQTTNGDYTISLSSDSAQNTWGAGFDTPTGNKLYGQGSLFTAPTATTNIPAYIDIQSTTEQIFKSARIRWCNTCDGSHKGHYKGWVDPVIQYSDDGTNWTSVITDYGNPLPFGGSDAYRAGYVYGVGNTQRTENYVLYEVRNVDHAIAHKYWRIYMRLRIQNNQVYSGERLDLFVSDVQYASDVLVPFSAQNAFFTEDNIYDIKFAQHDQTMILTNGTDPALQIEYSAGGLVISNHTSSLPYNTEGYPKCVAFYQNRLFFGGFTSHPTKVWGSAFGNYADFTLPGTILPTSPIAATCVEIKSIIENLWGAPTALYALSADGVSMIDGGGIAVATDHVEFKLRNHEPVDGMTPTVKNDMMVYLGRDKQKIFVTDYDLVVQRFRAINIAKKYSNHLKAKVKEMHIVPDRTDLIYGVLENGQMFSILFDQEQQVNGLFPIETNGFVNDIEPIKYQDKTKLCMLVQRSGIWQLEFKEDKPIQDTMDFMSDSEKKLYTNKVFQDDNYLDCAVRRTYPLASNVLSDLPYGDGQEVEVYADGRYIGRKTLSVSSDAGLFAWKFGSKILYTTTPNPDTSSVVYDANGEIKTGYVISAVDNNEITVYHYQPQIITYYGHIYVSNLTANITRQATGAHIPPVGTRVFNRDTSIDGLNGSSTNWPQIGWSNGSYWVFTYIATATDSRDAVYNGNAVSGSVTAITKSVKYTEQKTPNVGDEVYDADMSVYGTITSVGTDRYGNSYFVVDDHQYFYSASENIVVQEEEVIYETYARYSEGDVNYEGVALILDEPVTDVIVGLPYQSYVVIKFVTPYMYRKYPREIAVNFINTAYLEVGNTFDDMRPVLDNLAETIYLNNQPVLLNGNYEKTLDKHTFETPYVIINSDKGMPFIITGIDYEVDYSDYQGGV